MQLSKQQALIIDEKIKKVEETFLYDLRAKYPSILHISEIELIHLVQTDDCTLLGCVIYRIERSLFLSGRNPQLLGALAII